jgi:hypothetical protein
MEKMTKRLTIEDTLFIVALVLGFGVRFLRLGIAPLSDFEANWALQALSIAQGKDVILGSQPGYVLLTSLTFFIFGNSNMLARFWPAIAGSILVGVPFLFRRSIGSKLALLAVYGLALDPGLVASSRFAGSPMIAIGFGSAAIGFWYVRRPIIAGVLGGIALLGGPAVILGASGIGLAMGAAWIFSRLRFIVWKPIFNTVLVRDSLWAIGISAGIVTLLILGTLFFRVPQGLGALAGGLPAYLNGWLDGSQVPSSRLMASLLVYQPLGLLFGIVAGIRGWIQNSNLLKWMSLWLIATLILVLVYPARQVMDLVWIILPLWILAASELSRHLEVDTWERLPAFGQAVLIIVLLVLAWINLAGLNLQGYDPQVYRLRLAVVGGVVALIGITTGLVTLGWSPVIAQRGLAWGLGLTLTVYVIAALWGVSQVRPNGEQELWLPAPATQQTGLLMNTLEDLADYYTGIPDSLDLVVTSPKPSVRWALRNFSQVRYLDVLGVGELPAAVISPGEDVSPKFSVAYRGQDFGWSVWPAWQGALPPNWPGWLAFREGPQNTDQIILWVRGDVFPGGMLVTPEQSGVSPAVDEPSEDMSLDGSLK